MAEHNFNIYGYCIVVDCIELNDQLKSDASQNCIKLLTDENFPHGLNKAITFCAAKNVPLDDVNKFDRDLLKKAKKDRLRRRKKRRQQ